MLLQGFCFQMFPEKRKKTKGGKMHENTGGVLTGDMSKSVIARGYIIVPLWRDFRITHGVNTTANIRNYVVILKNIYPSIQ